jgi:hypothetical protein
VSKNTMDELKKKFYDADERAGFWLANGNEASGAKAEKMYDKAQFWTDRRNRIQDKIWQMGGETMP